MRNSLKRRYGDAKNPCVKHRNRVLPEKGILDIICVVLFGVYSVNNTKSQLWSKKKIETNFVPIMYEFGKNYS